MAAAKKTPAVKKAAAKDTGTAVAVRKTGAVSTVSAAEIRAKIMQQAQEMAGRTQPATGANIKLGKDKKFGLPDGSKVEGPLALVVVDFTSRNKFYDKPFDQNNPGPPACWAIHTEPKQMAPKDEVPDKQADSCGTCSMNEFKSGANGSGKACKNSRYLAVLPPDADADTELWFLEVGPTSIKNFDGFVNGALRTFQMPPVGLIVEVDFDPNTDYQKLTFSNPQLNDNLEVHFARQDEARDILNQDIDTSGYEAPQRQAPRAAPRKPVAAGRR